MTSEQTFKGGLIGRTCRILFGSRFSKSLRTRPRRRRLSVAYVAVAVALPVVGHVVGEMWAVLVLLGAFGVLSVLLAGATGGMFDKPLRRLDEGQRYMRQGVFDNPYYVGAAFGLAGGLIVAWALNQPEPVMAGWVLGVNAVVFGWPTVVGAWMLPEEVEDDG